MDLKRIVGLFFLLGMTLCVCPAQVVISEFMASNDGSFTDSDGWDADWIEITNEGEEEVNLYRWGLSDNSSKPFKWVFPERILAPGEILIVFASNHECLSNPEELHCNFKLSAEGGDLLLTDPTGTVVSSYLSYPKQYLGISYGVEPGVGIERHFTDPTPLRKNKVDEKKRGALFSDYQCTPALPEQPTAEDSIIVSIRVTPSSPILTDEVRQVELSYHVNQEVGEMVVMKDDGEGMDLMAGDGIYTGVIPNTSYKPGDMVRWNIRSYDAMGRSTRYPYFKSSDRSPECFGTVIAEESTPETLLPVIRLYPTLEGSVPLFSGGRWCVFYNGEFYDNVFLRCSGGATAYFPKTSMAIEFNKDHNFLLFPGMERYSDLRLLTTWGDKSKVRSSVSYSYYERLGTPAQKSFPVRVQMGDEFYGIYDLIEDGDSEFLERSGLDPEGALYKMDEGFQDISAAAKRTRKWEDYSDLEEFADAMSLRKSLRERTMYLLDHADVPALVNYFAVTLLLSHMDQGPKNFYLYHDNDQTGNWMLLPWDLDLTWGRMNTAGAYLTSTIEYSYWKNYWFLNNGLYDAMNWTGRLSDMINARMETLIRDEFYLGETLEEDCWFLREMRSRQADMDPEQFEVTDMDLDEEAWPNGLFRWTPQEEFDRIRNIYVTNRLPFMLQYIDITEKTVSLQIEEVVTAAEAGALSKGYIAIKNLSSYALDLTGYRLTGITEFEFSPGTVIEGEGMIYVGADWKGLRERETSPRAGEELLIVGSYESLNLNGNPELQLLNRNGELVDTFTVELPAEEEYSNLRITELMYSPAVYQNDITTDLDSYSWIKLSNCGEQEINLEGYRLSEGISYQFPSFNLAPGESVFLAKEAYYFQQRYQPENLLLLDGYSGNLSKKGEYVSLYSPDGIQIQRVYWNQEWYPETAGEGYSLEVIDPYAEDLSMIAKENYQPSTKFGGSPGYILFSLLPDLIIEDGVVSFTVSSDDVTIRMERSFDLIQWEEVDFETEGNRIFVEYSEERQCFYRAILTEEELSEPEPIEPEQTESAVEESGK